MIAVKKVISTIFTSLLKIFKFFIKIILYVLHYLAYGINTVTVYVDEHLIQKQLKKL